MFDYLGRYMQAEELPTCSPASGLANELRKSSYSAGLENPCYLAQSPPCPSTIGSGYRPRET